MTYKENARVLPRVSASNFWDEYTKEAIYADVNFCYALPFARGVPYRGPRRIYLGKISLKDRGRGRTRM
jgi:hypothetical protein